ncbi:MAG: hypothetical protein IT424_15080 [Pirellulales bacterium]|nr:hypothetical protein [Pirellulales bacterium]
MIGRRAPTRRGLTMVELVASMVSAAALTAGLSSTMFIALRASDPSYTHAAPMLETSACLADMAADLQYATAVTEATATSITVVVPDRNDADALPETIRYVFTSPAGGPLVRQINGGAFAAILPSVNSATIRYYPSAGAPRTISVTIQRATSVASTVHTAIPLVNMP